MHTTPQQHNATRFDGVRARYVRRLKIRPERRLFRSAAKIAGVLFMCASVIGVYSQIGSTVSYFSDAESSIGNRLQAGVALLSISSTDDEQGVAAKLFAARAESAEDATSTDTQSESFIVTISPGDESLPLVYAANGELDPSDPKGCDAVTVDATFGEYSYSGRVLDFAGPTTTTMGDWAFNVAIPDGAPGLEPDALCSGAIAFKAKLSGVSASLANTFTDAKRYAFSLRNPHAVAGKDVATSTEATTTPAVLGASTSTDPVATTTDDTSSSTPAVGSSGGAPAQIVFSLLGGSSTTTDPLVSASTSTDPVATTTPIGGQDAQATSTAGAVEQTSGGSGTPPDVQPSDPPASDPPATTPGDTGDPAASPVDPGAGPVSPPSSDQPAAPDPAPAAPPPAPSGGDSGGAPAGDSQ